MEDVDFWTFARPVVARAARSVWRRTRRLPAVDIGDMEQEGYLALLRAWGVRGSAVDPEAWAVAIARNAAYDVVRWASRRHHVEIEDPDAYEAPAPAVAPALDVREAIDGLPEGQARVVRGQWIDSLSWAELAAREGVGVDAVNRRCQLAWKRLRLRLEPYADGCRGRACRRSAWAVRKDRKAARLDAIEAAHARLA